MCDTHKRNQIGDPIQPRTSRDEENKRLDGIAFFSWDDRKKETREEETREVTRLGAIAWRAPKTAEEATAAILG